MLFTQMTLCERFAGFSMRLNLSSRADANKTQSFELLPDRLNTHRL